VLYSRSMTSADSTSLLLGIRAVGAFSSLVLFLSGLYVFEWWTPFAAVFASIPLWMVINGFAFKHQGGSLLVVMRGHIGMLAGIALCIYAVYQNVYPQTNRHTSSTEPAPSYRKNEASASGNKAVPSPVVYSCNVTWNGSAFVAGTPDDKAAFLAVRFPNTADMVFVPNHMNLTQSFIVARLSQIQAICPNIKTS